jgi:hypothetical protein
MKTTLVLDDTIFRQAKAAAALRGQALGQFVEEGLRRLLQEREPGITAPSWVSKLPEVPAQAARELQDTIAAADLRTVDRGMWE